jgi:hypothetical protein
MGDNDQRFKTLLQEFFAEFFLLFFPHLAARFDFAQVEWLDKELFADPPEGQRRVVDLVAKLATKEPVGGQRPGEGTGAIALVHVEVEHADRVEPLRSRMFEYFESLRRKHRLPVLPIALYLRVGLDGVGVDRYEEYFWDQRVLQFEYLYAGLPALDALAFVAGDNWLGVALAALMRIPAERKAWLKAEALRRLVDSPQSDQRRYLLCECVQAYLPLDPPQLQEYENLLITEPYQGVARMEKTTFERGLEEGLEKGLEKGLERGLEKGVQVGQRSVLRMLLEERFGPLSQPAQERLESFPSDQLRALIRRVLQAASLEELGLKD